MYNGCCNNEALLLLWHIISVNLTYHTLTQKLSCLPPKKILKAELCIIKHSSTHRPIIPISIVLVHGKTQVACSVTPEWTRVVLFANPKYRPARNFKFEYSTYCLVAAYVRMLNLKNGGVQSLRNLFTL